MLDIKITQKEKKEVRKLKTLAEIAAERGFPFVAIKERDNSSEEYEGLFEKSLPPGTILFVVGEINSVAVMVSNGDDVYKHSRSWRG